MTSPIEKQKSAPAPAPPPRRDWCCGSPIGEAHIPGCAYEPRDPAQAPEPPAPDTPVESAPAAPAASEDKPYGFSKPTEFDFWTPGGDKVRLRKLRRMQVIKLRLHDTVDSFTPELLKDLNGDDPGADAETNPEQKALLVLTTLADTDLFDRVLVAALICPEISLGDPILDEIELEDKVAIFNAVMPDEMQAAALEAQQEAFKSVRAEQAAGIRDLRDVEDVRVQAQ